MMDFAALMPAAIGSGLKTATAQLHAGLLVLLLVSKACSQIHCSQIHCSVSHWIIMDGGSECMWLWLPVWGNEGD